MMDYTTSLQLWDAATIKVTDVRHGLLKAQRFDGIEENSIFLFTKGSAGQIQVDKNVYMLRNAAAFHVGPNKKFSIIAHENEVDFYIVGYQAECPQLAGREMIRLFLQESPFETDCAVYPSTAGSILECCQRLHDAFHRESALNRLLVKQLLYAIVHMFFSSMDGPARAPRVDVPEQVRQYIELNYSQANPIQRIAGELNISRSSLHEQFKRSFGASPQQYLMQYRMNMACDHLRHSELTLQEIAVLCGLRDKDYFSRHFSRRFGMAPGAYRKEHGDPAVSRIPKNHSFTSEPRAQRRHERTLLIENGGRVHRYTKTPERIVCLNYATAELCAALGAGERIVGVANSEDGIADCDPAYHSLITQAPYLHKMARNVPSFHSVCACAPDIVVGTSYSFQIQGIAESAEFERKGIHTYAQTATCMLGGTFEESYEDIMNLGRILNCERRADELIAAMRDKEARLKACVAIPTKPIRVFSFDTAIGDRAYTCSQSLENHMISAAGGLNICSQYERQFAAVDWNEIASKNPQAIIVHRFYDGDDGEKKKAYLMNRAELAQTDAIRNNHIRVIGFKKVFPAIDNIDTAIEMAKWLGSWNET